VATAAGPGGDSALSVLQHRGVEDVLRLCAGEHVDHVLHCAALQLGVGLLGVEGGVRGEDAPFERGQRVVGGQRLVLEHVQAGALQVTGGQGCGDRVGGHQTTAGGG